MKCPYCGAEGKGKYCEYCGSEMPKEKPEPQTIINNNIYINTGNDNSSGAIVNDKKKYVALLLCIFLGYFGVHYFYVGKVKWGIIYLFTAGLFGIGWLVDIIRIATGSFYDKNNRSLNDVKMSTQEKMTLFMCLGIFCLIGVIVEITEAAWSGVAIYAVGLAVFGFLWYRLKNIQK